MKYIVNANTSEDTVDNYISFYKEDDKVWISIGQMEERGFTIEESKEIITKLFNCIENNKRSNFMKNMSSVVEDNNAKINLGLLRKYGSEFIQCSQISYYINGVLQFKSSGEIMVNRRERYPQLKILSPSTGDYTECFQENSCVYTDVYDLDIVTIETTYTPYKIGKEVTVKVILNF